MNWMTLLLLAGIAIVYGLVRKHIHTLQLTGDKEDRRAHKSEG